MRGSLLLAAALALPALADDAPVAQRPVFHAGDSFTYADRFETIACKDWSVEEVDGAGNLVTTRCGDYVASFMPDGGMTHIDGKDGRSVVKFSPQSAAIPFPLHVGQRWKARFDVSTSSSIASPTIDESCEVAAIEPVPVGIVTVPAFRIACTDRWSVAFLSGSNASTLWYAADARAVVKAVNPSATEWSLQMTGFSFH